MPLPNAKYAAAPGADDLGDLIREVRDLQQRVLKLEMCLAANPPEEAPAVSPSLAFPDPLSIQAGTVTADRRISNPVPILGRMLVAIAGAYVLRALTEWGVVPAAAGVAIGLIYALIWLWVAARAPAEAKFAAAVSCSTSVLIMAPLIWEANLRLGVMTSWTSAGVLAAFSLIALALEARTHHPVIAVITGASSIVMAMALLIARNDMIPFTTALLVVAAAGEIKAWRNQPAGPRGFASAGADLVVLLLAFLMSKGRMPETWIPTSPWAALAVQLALPLIYIGTAITQTVVRRRTLAFAEMAQIAAALLIGIGGAAWVFKEYRAVMLGLGIAALGGGLACYAVSFLLFERDNKRNFRAWATFGLFLVLAGFFLPFSRYGFWMLACGCAVVCCWIARRFHLPTLGLHGALYLLLGSGVAGVTGQPLQALFVIGSGSVEWLSSLAVLLAAALCSVAIGRIAPNGSGNWRNQISSLTITAHIAWITAGLSVLAVLALWCSAPPDTLATAVLVALSLALAWVGTHSERSELIWLLYGFMGLGAYKLAVRDFMNEHNLALVVSLLCYGGALILLPRMLRRHE